MKKAIIVLSILSVLSFGVNAQVVKPPEVKTYCANYNQPDWSNRYLWIISSVEALKKSNLPTNQVLPLCDSLTKFAAELSDQLRPQFIQQAKIDSIEKNRKPK